MEHSPETLMQDLLDSIAPPASVAQTEAAERAMAKAARPAWTSDEPFDVESIIAAGQAGEVLSVPFSQLSKTAISSREASTDEVARIASDALRRLSAGDDILKNDSDVEPPEDNPEDDEPVEQEPGEEVRKDIAFLRAQCGSDVDKAYELVNAELRRNYERGKALHKALAYGFKIAA